MRIAHVPDWHSKEEAFALLEANVAALEREHAARPFGLIVIPGDWWHGAPMATARARYADFLGLMRRLADMAPVAIIYGTPSHDVEGSLEVFEQLKAAHQIRILRPGIAYYLALDRIIDEYWTGAEAILFGLPEPSKKWLFAGQAAEGKDDSDAAVRDRLRALLLGYGAIRREHADLPCLLAYHGDIYGATTAVGHSTEIGTGIAVSRDDLAAVGADYYAFGHIHEPQEIPGLPGGYAGPGYPANFGETCKVGANIADIDKGRVPGDPEKYYALVSRLDFPHARRRKATLRFGKDTIEGVETCFASEIGWIEIVATREDAALIDTDQLLAGMLAAGALPGSRVTLNLLPIETVRSSEIVEKKALRDKVVVWAAAGGQTATEGALKKADELEREAVAQGAGQGANLRIDRLRLRGAKGTWKKGRKDEIDIDFEAMGEGVLALVGPNGYGKSTILENLHAWPMLLTRDGTLKDHFRLRDSARELWFTDLRTGWKYRALINIRADIASGAAEYFLFVDKGAGEEPLPGVDGRLKPYEEAIAALWGSLEMYLQTAFQAQKATKYAPDLGQATQGQRKALFAELAGIDYLERYRETCKGRGDELEAAIGRLDAAIAAASDIDDILEREGARKREAEEKARAADEEAKAVGTVHAEEELGRPALVERVAALDRAAERERQLAADLTAAKASLEAIALEIEGFTQAAAGRAATEEELARIRGLGARAEELKAVKAEADEAYRKALEGYQTATAELRRRQDAARAELDSARARLAEAQTAEALGRAKLDPGAVERLEAARVVLDKAEEEAQKTTEIAEAAKADLERLRLQHAGAMALPLLLAQLHDGEPCPVCGGADHSAPAHPDTEAVQKITVAGKHAADQVREAEAAALKACQAGTRARSALEAAETARAAAQAAQEALAGLEIATKDSESAEAKAMLALEAIQIPEPPVATPFPDQAALDEIVAELEWVDVAAAELAVSRAAEASVRAEEAGKRRAEIQARCDALAAEQDELVRRPADDAQQLLAELDVRLETLRDRATAAREAGAGARATAEAAERALGEAEKRREARDKAQAEKGTAEAELADWRFLERAVGRDGIQALELDALAPSIAEVANKLLGEAYGSRYQIEFRTQREAGKGKSAKMVEDFEIYILDTESGDEQTIDSLSGGEGVWIKKALYSAFGIIRARNTGVQFATVIQDEADGALDPEARMMYLRMVEAERRERGGYQTILVTHDKAIQAMVERTIDVTSLGPRGQASEKEAAA